MSTAFRLPDAFTPGATSATAATPTCSCCCCCSCAVSAISASVALPSAFGRDLRVEQPGAPREKRATAAAVLLALLPLTTIGGALLMLFGGEFSALAASFIALAAATVAFLGAAAGGSLAPWRTAGRLAVWLAVGVAEFYLGLVMLGLGVLGLALYGLALLLVPALVFRSYRRGR